MNRDVYRTWSLFFKIFLILTFQNSFPAVVYSQPDNSGSLSVLQQSNGFKSLKFGLDIKNLAAWKVRYLDDDAKPDADSCLKFEYRDGTILNMNGVALDLVGFRTYKGKIINVYLFFKREDGYKILQNFTAMYGKCTDKPGDLMYDWNTKDVSLALRYEVVLELGVAIFTSKPMEHDLSLEKQHSKSVLNNAQLTAKAL